MLSTVGPDSICQQVAGAVAIGILNTVAATADTGTIDSMVDGLTMTFIVCGAILLAAAVTAVANPTRPVTRPTPTAQMGISRARTDSAHVRRGSWRFVNPVLASRSP
jgi:hypothetical protein